MSIAHNIAGSPQAGCLEIISIQSTDMENILRCGICQWCNELQQSPWHSCVDRDIVSIVNIGSWIVINLIHPIADQLSTHSRGSSLHSSNVYILAISEKMSRTIYISFYLNLYRQILCPPSHLIVTKNHACSIHSCWLTLVNGNVWFHQMQRLLIYQMNWKRKVEANLFWFFAMRCFF